MITQSKSHYTSADYDLLEEGSPYQLIGGGLVVSPSPTPFHQHILLNLVDILSPFVRSRDLGKLLFAPLDVYLTEEDVYQPDIIFITRSKAQSITKEKLLVIPDLVIEVLSPSTGFYDFTQKKQIYCEHGVQEYWIVDPVGETVEVMQNEGKFYVTEQLVSGSSVLTSRMFRDLSIQLSDVFRF